MVNITDYDLKIWRSDAAGSHGPAELHEERVIKLSHALAETRRDLEEARDKLAAYEELKGPLYLVESKRANKAEAKLAEIRALLQDYGNKSPSESVAMWHRMHEVIGE